MRTRLLILPLALLAAPVGAAQACEGKAEIEAAFTAQHQNPWRTESASKSDTGIEQSQTFDFQPPDRIYRKVTSGTETVETVGVGKQAWTNATGVWEEMKAELANLVAAHMKTNFAPPRVSVVFKCLGSVDYSGKKLLGYQTEPETVEGKVVARTIYVDPDTKLPAFNVVGTVDGSEEIMKEAYSYPTDVKIEKPL
ncbi:hypothetical protein [Hyphomicrobium sp.]|uniref:hypothetical protein n=1 Tax=Hyphomicrobium sp. TaxID=82 RepID=UPI003F72231D